MRCDRVFSLGLPCYGFAQLVDNDTMSFCYAQAGGKSQASVVSCTELKRVR